MNLLQLNDYLNSILKYENYSSDIAINGIQIQNSDINNKQIKKMAFAVDACKETVKKAAEFGADVLFVHHGIFWSKCMPVTGAMYERVSEFIKNDIALIACHIPLDANNPFGNNWGLAKRIGLINCKEFGNWRGMDIGVKGELSSEITLNKIVDKLLRPGKNPNCVLNFGKEKIKTVGIISGGASEEVIDAINENLDCYITGEFAHEQYHLAKEMGINVIGGGHYETEVVGVTLIKEKIEKDTDIECTFIDVPTNL